MSSQIFNKQKTLDAFGGDEEILHSVSESFIAELPNELSRLRNAIDEGDLEAIRISTHTLKGQAGTFYAQNAKNIASELEAYSKDNEIETIKDQLEDFEKAFLELSTEISHIIIKKG